MVFDPTNLNIYRTNAADVAKENEGVWCDFSGGVKIKVAAWMNPSHQAAVAKAREEFPKTLIGITLTHEEIRLIGAKGIASGVVRDWSGVVDVTGVEVPYTEALGEGLFSREDMRHLSDSVTQKALDWNAYKLFADTATEKNL